MISLDDCIRRLDLTSGALSAPVELKEFVVGAGWLDVSETMLFLVTGKKNFHCVSDKEVLWTKPAATERRATSMAVIPGSPGKLAVALEQPGGYVGGVASNEFDIVFFEAGLKKNIESIERFEEAHMIQKDVQTMLNFTVGTKLFICC